MEYLFNINKKGTILFHPEVMKLCPEFAVLNDQEKLCLVLVCDYNSPFNQLPESDRKHKACLQSFGNNDISLFEKQVMKNAMELYKGLQYNPKHELIKVYQDKIASLSKDLVIATSPTAIKNILDSQKNMRMAMEELSKSSNEEEERKLELRGKGTLSLLEMITSNKEEYERVTKLK
jgi:hypothetical protein